MGLEVRDFVPDDRPWAREVIAAHQGGDHRVARFGELLDPLECEGLVATLDEERVGLLTVHETDRGLEVLSLHVTHPAIGAGTLLLGTAIEVAIASGAPRLWLVTTNDNLPAIRWYLRRGMRVAQVHDGAVDRDRATIKPAMPTTNRENGLPIHDLVELEIETASGERPSRRAFPTIEDLDALPAEAASDILRLLFEAAPSFLDRMAAARPFGDDVGLIAAARETALGLPEPEQIELLDAHPRIGADPATVSPLSHTEQGYDADGPPAQPWIAEELEALNDAYERIFGFRFVIFVAGRPRSAIVPILEASLRDERVSELRRGLDDVVHIANDRLAKLRAAGERPATIGA